MEFPEICAIAMSAALACVPTEMAAQQVAIGQYPLPTFGGYAFDIASGPDGAMWFTEYYGNSIGRITPAATIIQFPVPTTNSNPAGIAAGPDGALWFTESSGNKIGRITTAGALAEYPLPHAASQPFGIVAGPDDALWFTESSGNKIGRIDASGVIAEYPVSASPIWITAGADGALWFTDPGNSQIGRITLAGVSTVYPTLPAYGIAAGPDGALWFTCAEPGSAFGEVGRITTAGAITLYPIPVFQGLPGGIAAGPDGALWFTDSNADGYGEIGQITTAGVVASYTVPGFDAGPVQIASGVDGEMWFTIYGNSLDHIGEVVFTEADLISSPATGSYGVSLSFTGSAFDPNEEVAIYASGIGSRVLTTAMADGGGSLTASLREPVWSFGPRLFLSQGRHSGKVGAADFSVTPRVVLAPSSGLANSRSQVNAYGFGALEQVNIYWNDMFTDLLGSATADVTGSATLTITVPGDAASGRDILVARGKTTAAVGKGHFTVQ